MWIFCYNFEFLFCPWSDNDQSFSQLCWTLTEFGGRGSTWEGGERRGQTDRDAYGEDSGDQFSRQRDLVSSEESNRESVKNDGGPPQIQLAWNIFPGVIQKLLWPWLLVQLGRDVRHWKCLEFGRISVVNCRSRSLEEPKNSFNFFLSQYWFISFLSVINFLQSEARQTWVNFNCVEKCLIVSLLRTLWNSDQWLYCPYTFYVCHPTANLYWPRMTRKSIPECGGLSEQMNRFMNEFCADLRNNSAANYI